MRFERRAYWPPMADESFSPSIGKPILTNIHIPQVSGSGRDEERRGQVNRSRTQCGDLRQTAAANKQQSNKPFEIAKQARSKYLAQYTRTRTNNE